MRIHFWERAGPPHNFGDQLNRWLWPRALAGIAPLPDEVALVGIGTLLGQAVPLPPARALLILGSGTGYGAPHAPDATWRIYAVRGPLTAAAFGLDPALAGGDPALLVRDHFARPSGWPGATVGIMPHWRSAGDGWRTLCEAEGWHYIDPAADPEAVLGGIAGCEVLVTEALHGAVVADALRVPWIPVVASEEVLAFKWVDACRALGLGWEPARLPQLYSRHDGGRLAGSRTALRRGVAAARLRWILRRAPRRLSSDAVLHALHARWHERLARLRADAAAGRLGREAA